MCDIAKQARDLATSGNLMGSMFLREGLDAASWSSQAETQLPSASTTEDPERLVRASTGSVPVEQQARSRDTSNALVDAAHACVESRTRSGLSHGAHGGAALERSGGGHFAAGWMGRPASVRPARGT